MNQNRNKTIEEAALAAPMLKRGFKINEAAAYLGVKPVTVRRLIDRGLLRPCRALRTPIIPKEQMDALLEEGEKDRAC